MFERFAGALPARTSFRTARRAQLWYELRRNSLYLPGLILMTCVPLLPAVLGGHGNPLVIAEHTISTRLLMMFVLIVMPIFLAGAFSVAQGKFDFWSNKVPSFTPFFATRAYSTVDFVLTKWLAAALSTLLIWAILLVFAGCCLLTSTSTERLQIAHALGASTGAVIGRFILIFLLLMFLTWRNQVSGFFVPMFGRAWFTLAMSMVGLLQFIAIAIVGYCAFRSLPVRSTVQAIAPWVVYFLVGTKLVMAVVLLRILRRTQLVSASKVKTGALAWTACATALIAVLWGIFGPRAMLVPAAIFMLPVNRLVLAPLTLRANRHR